MPPATRSGATGSGPSHKTGGVRKGCRRSSPYATALAQANETAGSAITSTAATTAASSATNAVAHVAHKRISASVRGGVDQPASASPAAGPAVSGSEAHANRTNHSVIGAIGLQSLRERSIYYGPH